MSRSIAVMAAGLVAVGGVVLTGVSASALVPARPPVGVGSINCTVSGTGKLGPDCPWQARAEPSGFT